MDEKCIKCLLENTGPCKSILDEYGLDTDVTPEEEAQDEKRGVYRLPGSARAKRTRCIVSKLGAQRIMSIAEILQKAKQASR